jgi:hypothetical protein
LLETEFDAGRKLVGERPAAGDSLFPGGSQTNQGLAAVRVFRDDTKRGSRRLLEGEMEPGDQTSRLIGFCHE